MRFLQAVSDRYGACGVLALEGHMVVGKLRAYPQALMDGVPVPCVQQESTIGPALSLDLAELPRREEMPVLRLFCIQVAADHSGQGIAGKMLDTLIAWARAEGWRELRASAISPIPPLLNWAGQVSRAALERRGFAVTSSRLSPELREGVVSQRGGAHGEAVRKQWEAFAHLLDDEAAQVFEMTLDLGGDGDVPAGRE